MATTTTTTSSLSELVTTATLNRSHPKDPHGGTTYTVTVALPQPLTVPYWDRHRLVDEDIDKIVSTMPAIFIWAAGLLHDIDVSVSAIKPGYTAPGDVLLSSKVTTTRRIKKRMIAARVDPTKITGGVSRHTADLGQLVSTKRHARPVLDTTSISSIDHDPPLPRHFVRPTFFEEIGRLLLPQLAPFSTTRCPGTFTYMGHPWVALMFEGTAIIGARVVPIADYVASGRGTPMTGGTSPRCLLLSEHVDGEPVAAALLDDMTLFAAS
jgi:hypothetical protein